jgi:V8-like Glu-specific endopeptidase
MWTPIAPVLAVLATLIGSPVAVTASDPPALTSTVADVVSHLTRLSPASEQYMRGYWTPSRMRQAASLGPASLGPVGPLGASPRPSGPLLATPGGPKLHLDSAVPANTGALWRGAGTVKSADGKVFFTLSGRDYVCSASTVDSRGGDLVLTAGHCAKNGAGAWATNWVFAPGYRDGVSPEGEYPARRMSVPRGWADSGQEGDDVAMVAVATVRGKHVDRAAGAQRIAFGTPRTAGVHSFGYPAEAPYNGERLAYCAGTTHADTQGSGDDGLACDMTEGSSGGPWLSHFDASTGRGVITSVNAFKYADDPGIMYGPYFGPAIRDLYNQATGG